MALSKTAEMLIRPERPEEYPAIYQLIRTAFQTSRFLEGDEQDFIDQLRQTDDYLPDLALVAEGSRGLAGHILLALNRVATAEGKRPVLFLAILSVAEEFRHRGLGTKLVDEAFHRARISGHRAAVVVGDPAFYGRFGFSPAIRFGIRNGNGLDENHFLACELQPEALSGMAGLITLPE